MGNTVAQTLTTAAHTAAMTNKYNMWTGNDPTFLVESNATKAASLNVHPTTSTYGWTVAVFTQDAAGVCGVSVSNWLPLTTDQTSYKIRLNNTIGAGSVNGEIGLAKSGATTKFLGWKLKTIKRYKGALLVVD